MRYFFIYILACCLSCGRSGKGTNRSEHTPAPVKIQTTAVEGNSLRYADGFDFPIGKPNAEGYYNAQPFGENNHLGEDWNALTGGNTDLGDPIYGIGTGKVVMAENLGGGWGNVVRIVHFLGDGKKYESVYAHCDSIVVKSGDWVERGQQIATIGNAGGSYLAHLHLEIRDVVGMVIGGGYSEDQTGYIDPTAFIKANRTLDQRVLP